MNPRRAILALMMLTAMVMFVEPAAAFGGDVCFGLKIGDTCYSLL